MLSSDFVGICSAYALSSACRTNQPSLHLVNMPGLEVETLCRLVDLGEESVFSNSGLGGLLPSCVLPHHVIGTTLPTSQHSDGTSGAASHKRVTFACDCSSLRCCCFSVVLQLPVDCMRQPCAKSEAMLGLAE